MLTEIINESLKNREFINVATCDLQGRPNSVPKLLLKIEGESIYLVDYTIGRTYENLKVNPRVCLSFVNTETLKGYQINGGVEVITQGKSYEEIIGQVSQKQINLSIERVLKGVSTGKSHDNFELLAAAKKFAVFKIKMEEVVQVDYSGTVTREKTGQYKER
ncbi:MAG: pyridoxamine 5'-phosphate oxidase family protein [Candidatus Omnitrophica bacterium]|jgi:predicted pyridoxine 5'-phosphate oxidase superfamily flavin-nucleotide-binding protein|nr:pyridoxamine 5'-phosphate oxidase family protein [Candidatus Omnitrophota bacterium]MDD5079884.1 pyridoxamine 5'-phosphate oxidase family protein [Candidatus Omnitrophota bacterium]